MTTPTDNASRLSSNLGSCSGQTLGQYELVRRIGAGGMAEVYEAVHRALKKSVAVKVLLPDMAENASIRDRFLREGEAASRIRHPHVVEVTDVGEHDGVPYLVMELLEGETLLRGVASGSRIPIARTLDMLLPIAAALAETHRSGVIHRDIKPDNVFIARSPSGRSVPKLLDFGVSKVTTDGIPAITAVTSVLGTPQYMSPEQARGATSVDARADQYSLALVIYECITGALPFESENVVGILYEVTQGITRAPSAYAPDIPEALDAVLLKALSVDADQRYPDMDAFAEALLPFATPQAVTAYQALRHDETTAWRSQMDSVDETLPTRDASSTVSWRRVDGSSDTVIRVPPMSTRPEVEPERRRGRLMLGALGGSLVLALLVLVWPRDPSSSRSSPAAGGDEVSDVAASGATDSPGPATPEVMPVADEPAHPLAAPAPVRVVVVSSPDTATLELDGQPAGVGTVDVEMELDGSPHTLVVSADGYQPRVVTFTSQPPPPRVELEALPGRTPATMRARRTPSGATPDAPPRIHDNDLRQSR
ncbi:MAG: serine/threonine protein kinase [Sandaracinaceae bacterium]|nr:serine/threonine protein kinase [Myxococcales bacterium]MCB9660567.1 serine/threonine protein kinase [Sandaracinaceae bacterium]